MKKRLATDIILDELLLCGGELKSRRQIQDELLAEGYEKRLVDWYLFCLANHQPKEFQSSPNPKAECNTGVGELTGDDKPRGPKSKESE